MQPQRDLRTAGELTESGARNRNVDGRKAYQYRGENFARFDNCGTYPGARRHERLNDRRKKLGLPPLPLCGPCLEARRAYTRSTMRRRDQIPPERWKVNGERQPAECGTWQGWYQHRDRKETPCLPCRDALNVRHRELYRKRREAKGLPYTPKYEDY